MVRYLGKGIRVKSAPVVTGCFTPPGCWHPVEDLLGEVALAEEGVASDHAPLQVHPLGRAVLCSLVFASAGF